VTLGPPPVVTTYAPATTAWIDGFVVTVQTATASLDEKGGPVAILVAIRNAGTEDAALDAPIQLLAGEIPFELARGVELPLIPAGVTSEVRLDFEINGRATIADGVLRIGRPADHVVSIPLTANPSVLRTLQPREATLKAVGSAGSLLAMLRKLQIRWDLPDWHDELPLATEALTITYDLTYRGLFSGGIAFTADSIRLRLPDGTVVAPRADGHSQSIALIPSGKTARGLSSRFEIPDGLTGAFALVVRNGASQGAISFTIAPTASIVP